MGPENNICCVKTQQADANVLEKYLANIVVERFYYQLFTALIFEQKRSYSAY